MRRFLFGKKQALIEYILFMSVSCLFGDFVLEIKNSESVFELILFHLSIGLAVFSFGFFIVASKKFENEQQNC